MIKYVAVAERLRASAPFLEDYHFLAVDDREALRAFAVDAKATKTDPADVEFTIYRYEEVGRV